MTRRIPPVRRLLMDAKALIARPENWCKGVLARSVNNRHTDVFSQKAFRFCGMGAVWRAAGSFESPSYAAEAIKCLADGFDQDRYVLGAFNDAPETTHRDIMRLFNRAIKRAKEQLI